jgi:hypothetical protein
MATDVENLRMLSLRLKEAGAVKVRLEMMAGLRAAAKPLIPAARANAASMLPKKGGLAKRVSEARMGTSVRTSGRMAGVRVRAFENDNASHDVRATNAGFVRHPVFPDTSKSRDQWNWVHQDIPNAKGWWTEAMKSKTPEARAAMRAVLANVARNLDTGVVFRG